MRLLQHRFVAIEFTKQLNPKLLKLPELEKSLKPRAIKFRWLILGNVVRSVRKKKCHSLKK